jgi:2-polyprenyl-3-methyl-5-hydroxy-6-metoxy-1,4-benzoquinol methylase
MDKKKRKHYTETNRQAWNEAMPKHQAVIKDTLDKQFSSSGFIYQKEKEILQVLHNIDVREKDIIHVCCNNGSELLSLKNMGARRCVGIDICDEAIKEGEERAEKHGIACEFIRSDVYDVSDTLYNSFDMAMITTGCVGWIPDLNTFFMIIANLLRQNSILLIHEIHPFSEMLPFDTDDSENRLQIVEPYFRSEPIMEQTSLDYVGNTEYTAKTQYWFVHSLSDICMALINNNLCLEYFSEHTTDISACHTKQETLAANIPLSYIMMARKQ